MYLGICCKYLNLQPETKCVSKAAPIAQLVRVEDS